MTTLIIIFVVLAGLMCVFSVTITSVDFAQENKRRKQKQAEQEQLSQSDAHLSVSAVAVQPVAADGAVMFEAAKPTHSAKYAALTVEQRGWYDEIARYAAAVDGVKIVRNDHCEEYKLQTRRVVRMRIRRGTIVCEYQVNNPGISRYVAENKVNFKQAATVLKVTSYREVGAAKDAIDIAVAEIAELRRQSKELERERRRQAYKERRASTQQSNK